MAKISLTVKSTYVPNWGLFEGLRECLQNVRDARVMHGADVSVDYNEKRGVLTMSSKGRSIDTRALLLGFTTKEGREDAAGHYGEGLKLAMLALTRAGHKMTLRTGDETWQPFIESSEQFGGEKLLVVYTRKCKPSEEVTIEVGGITKEEWEGIRPRFLFLDTVGTAVETSRGVLLEDPSYKGKIFVKGIFVQTMENLGFGYDLSNANVDRDRRMIDINDAQYECGAILREATTRKREMAPKLYEAVRHGHVDGGSAWSAQYAGAAVIDTVVEQFEKEFGEDSYAVRSEEEARKLRDLGARAVVANDILRTFVEQRKGSFHANVTKLAAAFDIVQYDDLTDVERANYRRAADLIILSDAFKVSSDEESRRVLAACCPAVGVFRDATCHGMCKADYSGFAIARDRLANFRETLMTFVHETAHMVSKATDGEREFVAAQERIWSSIVVRLLEGSN